MGRGNRIGERLAQLPAESDGAVYAKPHDQGAHVIATPVLQVTASVVIALFLIQVGRRLAAQSSNPIAVGVHDGLTFLVSG